MLLNNHAINAETEVNGRWGVALIRTQSDAFDLYDNGGTQRIQERFAGDVATVIDQVIATFVGNRINPKIS